MAEPSLDHVGLCFTWSGPIEQAVAHLEANDVGIVEGPVERQGACGAGRSVYFHDPDGSLLEFISYSRVSLPSPRGGPR